MVLDELMGLISTFVQRQEVQVIVAQFHDELDNRGISREYHPSGELILLVLIVMVGSKLIVLVSKK